MSIICFLLFTFAVPWIVWALFRSTENPSEDFYILGEGGLPEGEGVIDLREQLEARDHQIEMSDKGRLAYLVSEFYLTGECVLDMEAVLALNFDARSDGEKLTYQAGIFFFPYNPEFRFYVLKNDDYIKATISCEQAKEIIKQKDLFPRQHGPYVGLTYKSANSWEVEDKLISLTKKMF